MAAYAQRLAELSGEQQSLVEQLKKDVSDIVQQHAHLQAFCHDWTYVRYLTARGWNLAKASKMLRATLEWRVSYKPHEVKWEDIANEGATGKQVLLVETDKEGKPVYIMRPRNENTKVVEGQVKFMVYNLERASFLADKLGVGKLTLMVDFEGYTLRTAPALKTSMTCLNIMQSHYPERLGTAICWHAPSLFSMTWKAISPFVDPITAKKIAFISKGPEEAAQMEARFDMSKLEECLGGGSKEPAFVEAVYTARMKQGDVEYHAFYSAAPSTAPSTAPAADAADAVAAAVFPAGAAAVVAPETKGELAAAAEGTEHQPIAVTASS